MLSRTRILSRADLLLPCLVRPWNVLVKQTIGQKEYYDLESFKNHSISNSPKIWSRKCHQNCWMHMRMLKDLHTGNLIFRCNSSGQWAAIPLSAWGTLLPHALLVGTSFNVWHHRLGHVGHEAFSKLVKSTAVTCNKNELDSLSHARQLGHHTRLPFPSSNNIVSPYYFKQLYLPPIVWKLFRCVCSRKEKCWGHICPATHASLCDPMVMHTGHMLLRAKSIFTHQNNFCGCSLLLILIKLDIINIHAIENGEALICCCFIL